MNNSNKKNKENNSGVTLNSQFKQQKSGGSIKILVGLALFLSIVSLISVLGLAAQGGYNYLQERFGLISTSDEIRHSESDNEVSDLGPVSGTDVHNEQLQNLQDNHARLVHAIKKQQQNISQLNDSFNGLVKDRYQWLLNETEYGLGIVALQLMNTGNIKTTIRSLNYIQERLKSFDYPELLPLRKSIAKDIDNLTSVQVVDMSDALVKLDVLGSKVYGLSLIVDSMLKQKTASREEIQKSINEPYYRALWSNFVATIKSGIQIKKLNSPDPMLISPEQSFFIKENLKLGLLNARLSLLQRQQEVYFHYLNQIKRTVREYFDVESDEVVNFLNSIEELIALNVVVPDIELMKNSISIVKSLQSRQIVVPIDYDNKPSASSNVNSNKSTFNSSIDQQDDDYHNELSKLSNDIENFTNNSTEKSVELIKKATE